MEFGLLGPLLVEADGARVVFCRTARHPVVRRIPSSLRFLSSSPVSQVNGPGKLLCSSATRPPIVRDGWFPGGNWPVRLARKAGP